MKISSANAQNEKDIFSQNLKFYMNRANKTQADLSIDLGITASTVSDWANAKKYPRVDKMQLIANYLGVLISDLRENHAITDNPQFTAVDHIFRIPIIGSVRCGYGGAAIEEFIGYDYANVNYPEKHVFFKVKGDSMFPQIEEGSLALVRVQPDVESGELAVVIVNGDEGTLKKVIKQGSTIILQSFNSTCPPRVYSGEEINQLRIYGKVVQTIKSW